jgi:steroid delta-isomerase-like uncharacterized protein
VIDARTFVDEFVAAIRSEDPDRYASLYAEEAVMIEPLLGEPVHGKEAIRAGEAALFDAFGAVEPDVRSIISAVRTIAVEVVMRAVNDGPLDLGSGEPLPATGRRIELPTAWFLQLNEEGKIVSEHDYFDTALILRQLGVG